MSVDDPTSYIRANKKLKKAVLEHYRLVKIFMCIFQVVTGPSPRIFFLVAWNHYITTA